MAGKASKAKSSGQAGEAEVKARNKRRAERLLKKFARRKDDLVNKYKTNPSNVSNDQLNRLIKWGVAPKKPSRPRKTANVTQTAEGVINVIEKEATTPSA
jgi:hypothetical protein